MSKKRKYKVIILDFDGVIVESVGIKDRAFEILFKKYPRHLEEIMKYHKSHNATIRFEKFKYITERVLGERYTQRREKELSKKFSNFVFNEVIKCPFVSGAKSFLNVFYRKIPLYVASVNPRRDLNRIIKARGLTKYFKAVYAFPWVKEKAICDILKREKASAKETIFIGDSYEDYQAARKAKIFFIGRERGKSFSRIRVPVFKNLIGIRKFLSTVAF